MYVAKRIGRILDKKCWKSAYLTVDFKSSRRISFRYCVAVLKPWGAMFQGGDSALQASCGRFDSDVLHQSLARSLMVDGGLLGTFNP